MDMRYQRRVMPWYFYPPMRILNLYRERLDLKSESELENQSAIYIHIPFCTSFCTYCCFYRILENKEIIEQYLDALEKEMIMYSRTPYVKSLKVGAVYIGGGTPSILSASQLGRIIDICKKEFNLCTDVQITVEANSASFDQVKLARILDKGANRISIGVQTFNDIIARKVNLPHTSEQAIKIIEEARSIGHKNISIDLMYNLPAETLEIWKSDLKTAIALRVDHITTFFLYVVPNTVLGQQLKNHTLSIGSLEEEKEMYETAIDMLTDAGYIQEGLTDFVKPGIVGWKYGHLRAAFTDVVAIGAGGVGYLNHCLYRNIESVKEYINIVKNNQFSIEVAKKNTKEEEMHGFMAVGFRAIRVRKNEFRNRFGRDIENTFYHTLSKLEQKGLIEVADEEIRLTRLGKFWGGNVCYEFFSPEVVRLLKKMHSRNTSVFWRLMRKIKNFNMFKSCFNLSNLK